MKKNLFHFLLLSAVVLTGGTLVACGDEVQELVNNAENQDKAITETTVGENCTLFSNGNDGTRTSMDASRKFFWTEGDQIYVNTSGSTYQKTSSSALAADKRTASFLLEGVSLKEPTCSVMYIGNGTNTASSTAADLEVTIKKSQEQSEWDNADHIGPSGDCGLDIATRDETSGKYSFKLNHKAAYLLFQPYKATDITRTWTLMKIEIITDGTTNVAGTYPFGTGELDVDNATTTSNTVTLTCGTAGFDLDFKPEPSASGKSCFAVIQPGTHAIAIRYTIKPEEAVNDYPGRTFTIERTIPSRTYSVNGVTTIKHQLGVESYSTDLFYTWDAVNPYWYGVSSENIPNSIGASYDDYPTAGDERDRWYNTPATVDGKYMAQNSCKDLPNINVVSWYIVHGDPRWETNSPWFYKGNGGARIYTYGAWFLKWENIPGKPAGDKADYSYDINSKDQRLISLNNSGVSYSNSKNSYKTGGRPSATEIDKYFFLPAMNHCWDGQISPDPCHGCYWTSSSPTLNYANRSYVFQFTQNEVKVTYNNTLQRQGGRIVAPDWFK